MLVPAKSMKKAQDVADHTLATQLIWPKLRLLLRAPPINREMNAVEFSGRLNCRNQRRVCDCIRLERQQRLNESDDGTDFCCALTGEPPERRQFVSFVVYFYQPVTLQGIERLENILPIPNPTLVPTRGLKRAKAGF